MLPEEKLKQIENFCVKRIIDINGQQDSENPEYVSISMEGRKTELKYILIEFFSYNHSDIERIMSM